MFDITPNAYNNSIINPNPTSYYYVSGPFAAQSHLHSTAQLRRAGASCHRCTVLPPLRRWSNAPPAPTHTKVKYIWQGKKITDLSRVFVSSESADIVVVLSESYFRVSTVSGSRRFLTRYPTEIKVSESDLGMELQNDIGQDGSTALNCNVA